MLKPLILVIDDNINNIEVLEELLKEFDYDFNSIDDSTLILDVLEHQIPDLILLDYFMPKQDGLETIKILKSYPKYSNIPVVILTADTKKETLAVFFKEGAIDFINKPINPIELKARISSILKISSLTNQLQKSYQTIRDDLKLTSKLQKSILPSKFDLFYKKEFLDEELKIKNIDFEWIYLQSSILSGDIFNIFRLDEYNIAFYHLDVAGHGIPASIMSVILSRMLLPFHSDYLKYTKLEKPFYGITSPSELFKKLNHYFYQETDSISQYFTIIYMILDIRTGKATYSAAGHTSPLLIRENGESILIDGTGFPIGLIEDVDYEEKNLILEKGDKLFFYSDGVTECTNNQNELFSEDRLINILKQSQKYKIKDILDNLKINLLSWNDKDDFDDDLSLLAIELK